MILSNERTTIDLGTRHPSVREIAEFFDYQHLPPHLRAVSLMFASLAVDLLAVLTDGPELTVALRKLVEAKDAAVRRAVQMARAGI